MTYMTHRVAARARYGLPRIARALCAVLAVLAIHLAVPAAAADDGLVSVTIPGARYSDARTALLDAIAAEGLTPPTISAFSDMLDRTAAALGHPQGLYTDAEIFTFCSARVAAVLVQESPANIARCPLSIALHASRDTPPVVQLGYRAPGLDSPGGRLAAALLQRIVSTTRAEAGSHGSPGDQSTGVEPDGGASSARAR